MKTDYVLLLLAGGYLGQKWPKAASKMTKSTFLEQNSGGHRWISQFYSYESRLCLAFNFFFLRGEGGNIFIAIMQITVKHVVLKAIFNL